MGDGETVSDREYEEDMTWEHRARSLLATWAREEKVVVRTAGGI